MSANEHNGDVIIPYKFFLGTFLVLAPFFLFANSLWPTYGAILVLIWEFIGVFVLGHYCNFPRGDQHKEMRPKSSVLAGIVVYGAFLAWPIMVFNLPKTHEANSRKGEDKSNG